MFTGNLVILLGHVEPETHAWTPRAQGGHVASLSSGTITHQTYSEPTVSLQHVPGLGEESKAPKRNPEGTGKTSKHME